MKSFSKPTPNRRYQAKGIALVILAGAALAAPTQAEESGAAMPSGATIGYTCMGCHGVNGKSPGSIPSLVGQSEQQLRDKMLAFKDGSRPATVMDRIAKGYTDAEIAAVSRFFANLPR